MEHICKIWLPWVPALSSNFIAHNLISVQVHVRLCGGKGGFGSMLRALGAQIEKTTNHEAMRDLSGRRVRDVNNEKVGCLLVTDQFVFVCS